MNQILQTRLDSKLKIKKIKLILKVQLYFSILLIFIIGIIIFNNISNLVKQEKFSNKILDNYNITKLYSNLSSDNELDLNENIEDTYVIGIIEIPKIDIYYPIFSICSENLLKFSPCRLYGTLPGKVGNLCIAGHNYDNNSFFSKIWSLDIGDEIILYNNTNKKFSYFVNDIYEVSAEDLSPIYNYDDNSKILTLVTCNNLNDRRIIVRALN